MLINVIAMRMMKMPIVQIVNVILVDDPGVTAARTMGVIVTLMNVALRHFTIPF